MASEQNNPGFDRILLDPAAHYDSPADVVSDEQFPVSARIEILRRWEYDAADASVAAEEGMPGGNGELIADIIKALQDLGAEIDTERTAPTKQGGLGRSSIKTDK
ncbi:hypothetical protein [Roseibium aggregatum]|uniref:Uncharacterized protein n=1 Tax=Roseibium aggregatum TaxID=187304 RepID=A0A926P4B5_9HYPH|nr:hypothetical protein [Roseibium aggregatum]MBD1546647.1 hypothetical protein [Roseibium aggregatum]